MIDNITALHIMLLQHTWYAIVSLVSYPTNTVIIVGHRLVFQTQYYVLLLVQVSSKICQV